MLLLARPLFLPRAGRVFISESGNSDLRVVEANGTIRTLLGGLDEPRKVHSNPKTGALLVAVGGVGECMGSVLLVPPQ